ncbi:YkgJ family cysteine cluster protein [Lysobacter zhanggongensis]|uniref:YkgJ family cysteine cluster protein n=1 Tax=Lysobacter zhanggongensis TaxID=1774951 RepID=A0ABU7YQK7_9GAMM
MNHPCLSCGACCAHFRVGFHWSETEPMMGGTVPAGLTARLDPHRVYMRGTWSPAPRCIALDAEIGVWARCTIHPDKPSVCREVLASWEFGAHSPQCDKARIAHGLAPLTPADWHDDGDIAA